MRIVFYYILIMYTTLIVFNIFLFYKINNKKIKKKYIIYIERSDRSVERMVEMFGARDREAPIEVWTWGGGDWVGSGICRNRKWPQGWAQPASLRSRWFALLLGAAASCFFYRRQSSSWRCVVEGRLSLL